MDRNEMIDNNLDISDRMHSISDELKGLAEILFIMYENEVMQGSPAEYYLMLRRMVAEYGEEIKELADKIKTK